MFRNLRKAWYVYLDIQTCEDGYLVDHQEYARDEEKETVYLCV